MDLTQLARGLDAFAVLDPTHLPLHHAQVLVLVARDGPCTFRHLEEALNLSPSAISRTVQALGPINRKGQAGYNLLTVERDPEEGRRFLVMLTTRGQAFKRNLERL
jgi:DNA-binding MarR family transcriptional regulator